MPESVKISQLPVASSVQGTDLIPVVKMVGATPAETNRATAAQIAAVGGGPPGVNTVTNQHVADSGLQARKLGFTATDRIAYSSTNTDTVEGQTRYRCTETTLTAYARELLSKVDAASAWTHLAANPNYSGPIRVPPGSPTNPTYTFTGANNSGLFLVDDSVCISANGQMLYMFSSNRDMYSLQAGSPAGALSPAIPFRAYVIFNKNAAGTQVTLDTQREVGEFLGFRNYQDANGDWNGPNIWNSSTVVQGLTAGCINKGVSYVSHQSQNKDGQSNYSSPGNNSLIVLASDGTSTGIPPVPYQTTAAQNQTWVGKMIYETASAAPTLVSVRNISTMSVSSNIYTVNFVVPMPDTKYGIVGSVKPASGGAPGAIRVTSRTTTSCAITYDNQTAGDEVFVGIVR